MTPVIGIDPGLNGALCLLLDTGPQIVDMPTIQVGTKRRIDATQLALTIDRWSKYQGIRAVVELVGTRPGEGAVGAFSFGRSVGVIHGVLAAHYIPTEEVTPQSWKRAMRCPADKDGSRLRATEIMPRYACMWPLKKHDGRAESFLIATWVAARIGLEAA